MVCVRCKQDVARMVIKCKGIRVFYLSVVACFLLYFTYNMMIGNPYPFPTIMELLPVKRESEYDKLADQPDCKTYCDNSANITGCSRTCSVLDGHRHCLTSGDPNGCLVTCADFVRSCDRFKNVPECLYSGMVMWKYCHAELSPRGKLPSCLGCLAACKPETPNTCPQKCKDLECMRKCRTLPDPKVAGCLSKCSARYEQCKTDDDTIGCMWMAIADL